jgi:2-polyprenyl-3-methyl-5-hydroxy-6-metoxy-1,4-benzoquinol methylase
MENNYRTRIYDAYLTGRQKELAPETLDALKPRIPFLKKLVRRHFPPNLNASILDLGCGNGALIYVARQMGYGHVRGIDGSLEQVAAAKALGIDDVQHADALEALGKEGDSSLDCVVCFDLLEHFTKDELIPLVDAIHRVLKTTGRWIIHTPNAESPFGMKIRYGDLTHELAFTRMSLSQLLLSSGFSQVRCYEDEPIPHGLKSGGRLLLWKCFRSLFRLYLAAETGNANREAIFSQNVLAVVMK